MMTNMDKSPAKGSFVMKRKMSYSTHSRMLQAKCAVCQPMKSNGQQLFDESR